MLPSFDLGLGGASAQTHFGLPAPEGQASAATHLLVATVALGGAFLLSKKINVKTASETLSRAANTLARSSKRK